MLTTAAVPCSDEIYLTAAAARRLVPGLSTSVLQRLALIGRVQTQIVPGETPRYRQEDLLKLPVHPAQSVS